MSENLGRAPSPADYSESKTRAEVIKQTLQNPVTLALTASGVVGGLAIGMLSTISVVGASIITAGGVGLGALAWATVYALRKDRITREYHETLHKRFDEVRIARIRELEKQLSEVVDCPQGREQVKAFDEKFNSLAEILRRKLSTQELTYSRYIGNAESICSFGIGNLEKIVNFLTTISNIDIADIRRKISRLSKMESRSASDERQLSTFKERERIYEEVHTKVGELIAQNEESLTVLNKAALAVAEIQSTSSDDMELAMADMLRLAQRQAAPKFRGLESIV